jgi:tetratricopeptide (TPR) repeat protein
MAMIDIVRGDSEKALDKARQIQEPALAGYAHVFVGRYREALQELENAVEQNILTGDKDLDIQLRLMLGEMHAIAGNHEEAVRVFSEIKSMSKTIYHPEYNPVTVMSEYWIGWAQLQRGDLSAAETRAEKIAGLVNSEPYDAFFRNFHHMLSAEIDLSRGDHRAAEGVLANVSRHTSTYSPHFRALQAKLEFASGDHAAAIRTYDNMCNEVMKVNLYYGGDELLYFLNCSQVNYNLGRTYEAMGDAPRAIEYYEKALDQWKNADEDHPELIDTERRLTSLRASS